MDRFEDDFAKQVRDDVRAIYNKLNELAIASARQACPSPGACVSLSAELQHVIAAHNATMLRVERLELDLIKLNQQKAWIIGAWSTIAFLSSVIGAAATFIISKIWRP